MEQPIVVFENVSKRYPSHEAVRNLTFELQAGKVIAIIGPNGSGKTTTLKLLTGLLHPTSGRIRVNRKPVSRRSGFQISYLSDATAVYPIYTVIQMVEYYHGLFSDFDVDQAREMLTFMNINPGQSVRTLSKGNLGRLKIVLAVSRKAPIIVMDEPLSGLDPIVRQSIIKGLISFVDLGSQTVVLSTHEVEEVEPIADLVILMDEGQIKAMEYTEDIRSQYGQNTVDWMQRILVSSDAQV